MARNRAFHRIALRGVSRINLSRRLICWMDGIRMPRTALRIPRYVCSARLYQQVRLGVCVCAPIPTRQVRLDVLGECVHSGEKVPEKGGFTEVKIWGGKKPEI